MRSISICIPVFNCDVTELVNQLAEEFKAYQADYEVVIIDDASSEKYKKVNKSIKGVENLSYIKLDENIGRSAIRNLFLNYTRFENLLFLDCDSILMNKQFISNYLGYSNEVVCGGRQYSKKPKTAKYRLRWKYGIHRECKKADERAKNPYQSFMTNNFMVKRDVLKAIKFDERLSGYGHEDSLFGYQLMRNNIPIQHIDNPTIHDFNETSDEFLKKTWQGIENLAFIHSKLLPNGDFTMINKLLATYEKVKMKKMTSLLNILSYPLLPIIAALFRVGIVPLWCFDAYKLLCLCRIKRLR